MQQFFSTSVKLGILGGGQLGKMLLAETQKWDIYTCVLDPSSHAPCANICNAFYQGDLMDYETVYNFGKNVDFVTVEIEHINTQALEQLQKEGVRVFPQPEVLKTIQHKGTQKDFFIKHKLPTVPYKRFESKEDLLKAKMDYPVIWKAVQLGYDGNGVKRISSHAELMELPNIPCIIEDFISIEKEFAVIVARNKSGYTVVYPVVEMHFNDKAHQVEYVQCPASIDTTLQEQLTNIALQTSEHFGHIGLLTIEFILDKSGNLYINEVAPRPHNSGHYSIEASYTNQFEQHLRAILNVPLGNPSSILPAVMVNLVGEEGFLGEVVYKNIDTILAWKGVTPHIYGKKYSRANRKMGHVTVINTNIDKAFETARKVKRTVRVTGTQQQSCD